MKKPIIAFIAIAIAIASLVPAINSKNVFDIVWSTIISAIIIIVGIILQLKWNKK